MAYTMSYEAMNTTAVKIDKVKSDLEQVISAMDSAIRALASDFHATSYDALANAWQESKPTMQRVADAVGNFSPVLKNAAAEQKDLEEKQAKMMSETGF